MELKELIKFCLKNNLKAQSQLYNMFKDVLYILCLKYCKNIPEAEDHLHDSFIKIFDNLSKYKNKGSFEGWMKRIVINSAIDKYKKSFTVNTIDTLFLAEKEIVVDDKFDEIPLHYLLKIIQELPDMYRTVFNLHELDGYKHKEIASLLSISIGTSKSNLHRAKALLQKKVNAHFKTQDKLNYGS